MARMKRAMTFVVRKSFLDVMPGLDPGIQGNSLSAHSSGLPGLIASRNASAMTRKWIPGINPGMTGSEDVDGPPEAGHGGML